MRPSFSLGIEEEYQTVDPVTRDLIEEFPVLIDPVVDELGSREAIDGVHKIMKTGTGADRQLKVFEESGGDLKAVVDYMAQETAEGL